MHLCSITCLFALAITGPLVGQGGELEFHGQVDLDWNSFAGDDVPGADGNVHGAELRRTRFIVEGHPWQRVDFRVAVDLDAEESEAWMNNLWLQVTELPALGRLRIGYFREPFGLERNTPSRRATFLERSPAAALTPNRNFGVAMSNSLGSEDLRLSAGIFRASDVRPNRAGSVMQDATHFTGRLTYAPWQEDNWRRLLHLGASFSRRGTHEGAVDFSDGLPLHAAGALIDTGTIVTDSLTMVGVEAAAVVDEWSVQAEWLSTSIEMDGASRTTLSGYYAQLSYFLTGESRSYRPASGHFGWPAVTDNVQLGEAGTGAWEIAARFSQLDFSSGSIAGGELTNGSLGLNWYLNSNWKAQLGYEQALVQGVGTVSGLGLGC